MDWLNFEAQKNVCQVKKRVLREGNLNCFLTTFVPPLCLSEMLAWASAQIHCQFHACESRVALPVQGNKQDVQAESDTVLIPSRG